MYTLLVNTSDAIVTVRWVEVGRTTDFRAKYYAAKNFADSTRKKKPPAGRSSSPTMYALRSITHRIARWRAWRSSWVYDARRASGSRGLFPHRNPSGRIGFNIRYAKVLEKHHIHTDPIAKVNGSSPLAKTW